MQGERNRDGVLYLDNTEAASRMSLLLEGEYDEESHLYDMDDRGAVHGLHCLSICGQDA